MGVHVARCAVEFMVLRDWQRGHREILKDAEIENTWLGMQFEFIPILFNLNTLPVFEKTKGNHIYSTCALCKALC